MHSSMVFGAIKHEKKKKTKLFFYSKPYCLLKVEVSVYVIADYLFPLKN